VIGHHKATALGDTLIVLSPEDARTIAGDGWSKADVRRFLWERCRKPVRDLLRGRDGGEGLSERALAAFADPEHDLTPVPKFRAPEHSKVLVAGGRRAGSRRSSPGGRSPTRPRAWSSSRFGRRAESGERGRRRRLSAIPDGATLPRTPRRRISAMRTRVLAAIVVALAVLGAATSSAADRKTVRLWQTETEPQTLAVLNQIAADFEKTHPDVSIKIEGLAWGDLEKKLTAALAAGAPPDAAHGQPITCTSFAAKGLLRPVDDLVKAIGEDNLVDAFRNLCRWDGRSYGVGHSPASSLFVYRKDLLAQKGLKVPRTWDELIQVADALKEVKDGQVVRYGLTLSGQPLFVNIQVGEFLKGNGGRLFDAEGRPTLTEKPVIELLDFYKKLNRVLPPGWTGHSYLDTFANLANGKAAMQYQAYGRGVGYIEKYAPKEIADPDHFAVADKVVGPSGKTPAAQLDAEPWMVFKDARGAAEAVEFLKFFYKDDNYVRYLHSVPIHLLPMTKSTYRNPKYADNATIKKWRPWVDMQERYFKNDWIKPVLVTEWDDMKKPYLLEVMGSGILVDMVLDAVKAMPSAESAAKAQKRVEELLAQAGYLKR
jgi:multiple sugar transport system substrate-binding protein